jgi:uncharacterized Zn-binding protein involved in type VI secretion
MKHDGRGVIRINDQTDHGGKVTSASSGTIVMGLEAALEGDMTFCPRCKGAFAIKTDRAGAKHNGKHYAYHGDVAACGARLISSLSSPIAEAASAISQAVGTLVATGRLFDDKYILIDEDTGDPLPNTEYAIKRANGRVEFGTTDEKGHTHLLAAAVQAESIEIYS